MVYSTSDLQGRQRELLDEADRLAAEGGAVFINRRHVLYRLEKVMDYNEVGKSTVVAPTSVPTVTAHIAEV